MQMMNYSVILQGGYQMIFTSRLAIPKLLPKGSEQLLETFIFFLKRIFPIACKEAISM
jgi:hypothetical protein